MSSRMTITNSTGDYSESIKKLKQALAETDAVVIGAGAGLSTAAGLIYTGGRFEKYFGDFAEKYGFKDMYAGGFYPFRSLEENWAYWSRYIYVNRFMNAPETLYRDLLELVQEKDYFVLTTNVDHQFQKAGFDKMRIFYTQGDYGLWQCSRPCHKRTYNNKGNVVKMVIAQGFAIGDNGELLVPEKENGETDFDRLQMTIPSDLIPYCPVCGEPMSMNLRGDDTFVEDEGWHQAADRYENYLMSHEGKILFLELGVGYNTPGIIKYPFWNMTANNPEAIFACINSGEAVCPEEIAEQAICIDGDIKEVLEKLVK